jgi:ketosteroid isomerase-like protein
VYRSIVKSKVRKTFEALSDGRPAVLLDQLADPFVYEFVGDHALGGTRTTRPAMEAWFDRLERIFGRLRFTPTSIEVGGMPWATTVLTEVEVTGSIGGESYRNVMFQRIELSFGRIRAIRTLEDTQLLVTTLDRAAQDGLAEATADPITD